MRYGLKIDEKIVDLDLAAQITQEMQQRCGVTIKEMSRLLGIGRESLRKRVVANTVP